MAERIQPGNRTAIKFSDATEIQQGIITQDLEVNNEAIMQSVGAPKRGCIDPHIILFKDSAIIVPSPSGGVNEYTCNISCGGKIGFSSSGCNDCSARNKIGHINSRRPLPVTPQ